MLITYFIFLLIAITFRVLHWPGSALILLVSILFPFIDILVQAIRKKPFKEIRIWSAIVTFLISFFLLFKLLYWPGSTLIGLFAILVSIVFAIRYFQLKPKLRFRYILVLFFFLFAVTHLVLAPSTIKRMYMIEDPFDRNAFIPAYSIHSLAFQYNIEGEVDKSRELLIRNVGHFEKIIKNKEKYGINHDLYEQNLAITRESLIKLNNNEWNKSEPVYPIDIQID